MAKTVLQMSAKTQMRGRVMALWAMVWQGSTPVGGPFVGWVGEHAGARWSLLVGGIPTIVVGLLAYPALSRLDGRDTAAEQVAAETLIEPARER
jgi:MFS family permease